MVQNNQKKVFMLFLAIVGPFFFAVWASPNGPRKILKGLQVSGMYGSMSKIKNKPLTNSL
jgi:hypothetical protein